MPGSICSSLINEVLDLSKIEAGRLELHIEEFDIAGIVQDAATTAQPIAQKNRNRIVIRSPDNIGSMRADQLRSAPDPPQLIE